MESFKTKCFSGDCHLCYRKNSRFIILCEIVLSCYVKLCLCCIYLKIMHDLRSWTWASSRQGLYLWGLVLIWNKLGNKLCIPCERVFWFELFEGERSSSKCWPHHPMAARLREATEYICTVSKFIYSVTSAFVAFIHCYQNSH